MPYARYPASYTTASRVTRFAPRASLVMGGVGAVIGGVSAAARNIRRVRESEVSREEAVRSTLKDAAGTGLAAAAATAVVGAVGASGFMALAGIVVVATGAKYLWDAGTAPVQAKSSRVEAKPEKAVKKNDGGPKPEK